MTAEDLALLGITPESILQVYAWGFGALLGSFLAGYVVSVAIGIIRRA